MRCAGGSSGFAQLTAWLMTGFVLVVTGCESPTANPVPHIASVSVRGQVTDPSGTGVEAAVVTFRFHETTSCASPEFASSSVETDDDGRFSAGPPGIDVDEGFLPAEVCMAVRAEPPPDREALAPVDTTGFEVTLRDQLGQEPLDEVEVNLVLVEAGS